MSSHVITLLADLAETDTFAASTPKLRVPFSMGTSADGSPVADTVEQDGQGEVAQCVYAVLGTRLGEHPIEPDFGIEDQAFTAGANVEEMSSAVERWEPRAEVTFGEDFDGLVEQIAVGVEVVE